MVASVMLACTDGYNPEIPVAKEGLLPGKFSVDTKGNQVQFSQGNLQYQASTETWRFAEHQWEYIGDGNKNISATYEGWIDLFGWGTGSKPTLTSIFNNSYQIYTEWGRNKIANGNNTAYQCRTLSKNEWGYLLEDRPNAKNLCAKGTVVGVHGFIILPDDWKTPRGLTWQGLQEKTRLETNVYTAEEWYKMEVSGAVFLPAAGQRGFNAIRYVGSDGLYWSSTPADYEYAYSLVFDSNSLWPKDDDDRFYGRSVRLVHSLK